jgi:hypothetical protein
LPNPSGSPTCHDVRSAESLPVTFLPAGFVSVSDSMVPSLTETLTGATGLTFRAPAVGFRAIFAGGAAAGTSCSAPEPF